MAIACPHRTPMGLVVCPESGWRYQEVESGVMRCLDWPKDQVLTI